jgi:hypothetical protein
MFCSSIHVAHPRAEQFSDAFFQLFEDSGSMPLRDFFRPDEIQQLCKFMAAVLEDHATSANTQALLRAFDGTPTGLEVLRLLRILSILVREDWCLKHISESSILLHVAELGLLASIGCTSADLEQTDSTPFILALFNACVHVFSHVFHPSRTWILIHSNQRPMHAPLDALAESVAQIAKRVADCPPAVPHLDSIFCLLNAWIRCSGAFVFVWTSPSNIL